MALRLIPNCDEQDSSQFVVRSIATQAFLAVALARRRACQPAMSFTQCRLVLAVRSDTFATVGWPSERFVRGHHGWRPGRRMYPDMADDAETPIWRTSDTWPYSEADLKRIARTLSRPNLSEESVDMLTDAAMAYCLGAIADRNHGVKQRRRQFERIANLAGRLAKWSGGRDCVN